MQLSIPSSQLAFSDNTLLHSSDMDEALELINKGISLDKREFTLLKQKSPIQIALTKAGLNNTSLYGCRFGNFSVNVKSAPLQSFHVIIPFDGSLYNHVLRTEINPGEMALFLPSSHVDVDWRRIKSSIILNIKLAQMEQYLGRRIDEASYCSSVKESLQKKYHLNAPDVAGLCNIIHTIYTDSRSGNVFLNNWQCRQSLENILFESVSALLPELHADQSNRLLPGKLKSAIEYIEENNRRPISIPELANVIGYSRRALENSFKSAFGVGPGKYISEKRLLAVRQILLESDESAKTVGDIASQWGYFNTSYFTKLYRDRFGETPATTLRKHY